jgi:hypothetical protein
VKPTAYVDEPITELDILLTRDEAYSPLEGSVGILTDAEILSAGTQNLAHRQTNQCMDNEVQRLN